VDSKLLAATDELNLFFFRRYKIGDHLALLQAEQSPGSSEEGSPEHVAFMKNLEFAKVALPPDVVNKLPGGSFVRRDGIMDDHFALSGKIKVLDGFLKKFSDEGSRVLLFSFSTQTLDLIQNYMRAAGHSHLRMDGKTATSLRQELANQFNNDETILVFLLSTRAMGTGLNLTVRFGDYKRS
jgi:SNF2 family DNA or RNA helicase